MIFHITFKDIAAFIRSEKKVFFWLLVCMVCSAFVLNYSYSFARYQGRITEWMYAADQANYSISCINTTELEKAKAILSRVSESDFPEIDSYRLFRNSEENYTIIGSTSLNKNTGNFTGVWTEGYSRPIENTGENVCAVSNKILDYGENIVMLNNSIEIDGEQFIIKGVFSPFRNDTGVVMFADKFIEKYDDFVQLQITFTDFLTESQHREFERVIRENVDANLLNPAKPETVSSDTVRSAEIGFSFLIVMLVLCLVSLLKYWQQVNLPAYTVYWINGATNGDIMRIALCESLILCVTTYAAGLGLNVLARRIFSGIFSATAPLKLSDIGIGFGIFFGTFAIFTLINAAKICKTFRVSNVRRD